MNKKNKVLAMLSVLVGAAVILFSPKISESERKQPPSDQVELKVAEVEDVPIAKVELTITHKQMVWLYALEWCESNGEVTAVNGNDTDGTPSYYSYQFKPGTFRGYGEKYGVIEKGLAHDVLMEKLKSHELQRKIVENMIIDPTVVWTTQFPGCVRKLGLPPR